MQLQDDYFAAYRSLKLTRDASGVLVVEFHSNGGPFTFTAQDHTEFVDAFYRIAQDRANKIVILTGAGGDFIPEIDFSSFGNVADPGVWSQVHDEGVQLLENIANIRVPVIAAIEGRDHVHSEYALLANVIVAGEGATLRWPKPDYLRPPNIHRCELRPRAHENPDCAPYSKERFETARQNSILHPERIVGNREVIPRNVRESEHCRPKLRELHRSQAAANV
jgi:hypothetical protein